MRASAPTAFRSTGRGKEWVGWLSVGVGFMIVAYYAVIMGWCVNYLGFSFDLSWGTDTQTFFINNFLKRPDIAAGGMKDVLSFRPSIILALVFSWFLIIMCIWKGARSVGKVVYLTVPLPWLCLVIFVIKGLSLPGAEDGIAYYLTPDFQALMDGRVWLQAYSQVFFSLSIGFGMMIAYASFLPRTSDIVNNAFIVSLADVGTAFVGGFAVFGTLGYYAHETGVAVEEVVGSGIGLAFITYPSIINHLGQAARFFGVVFFLMLVTLAIDSAFSLVEAVAAGFMDKYQAKRLKVNVGVSLVALTIGLVYTSRAGIYWLDIVDHFMNSFGLVVVALIECIVIGYFYGTGHIRRYVNSQSEFAIGKWWDVMIMIVTPAILGISIGMEIWERFAGPYGGYPRWAEVVAGWSLVVILPTVAVLLMRSKLRKESPVDSVGNR
jgi:NSS family neurotransmitter:Na+ symporter